MGKPVAPPSQPHRNLRSTSKKSNPIEKEEKPGAGIYKVLRSRTVLTAPPKKKRTRSASAPAVVHPRAQTPAPATARRPRKRSLNCESSDIDRKRMKPIPMDASPVSRNQQKPRCPRIRTLEAATTPPRERSQSPPRTLSSPALLRSCLSAPSNPRRRTSPRVRFNDSVAATTTAEIDKKLKNTIPLRRSNRVRRPVPCSFPGCDCGQHKY